MSAQRFVTFEPIQGVFKKAINPYKSWREGSDMSQKIEIDGNYYRLLRTTRIINKLRFRKVIVCTEEGHIIKDEQITRECLRIMLCIIHAELNKADMEFLLTQGKKSQHEPMDFHLYYLEEVYRIQYELSQISQTLLNDIDQLRAMLTDVYDYELLGKLYEDLSIWTHLKDQSEAILHEDGIRARKEVMKIMRNYEYLKK